MKQSKVFTYGRHALSQALGFAPQAVTKVYLDPRMTDTKLRRQVDKLGVPVGKLSEGLARADAKSGAAHQGIVGSISIGRLMRNEQEFFAGLQATAGTAVVVLAGVQDPHNVGTLIRSAAALGAAAVLMPERGQSPVTSAVIRASAGMAFRLPLVQVAGATDALRKLGKAGFVRYALAGEGATPLPQARFTAPAAFVLGNEGEGIAPDLLALCDERLAIPMHGRTESLNVAAAGAVALYAWSAQHPESLQ